MNGKQIFYLIKKLWNINRSIAGPGNKKTLLELKKINKKLKILKYKSREKIGTWTIPDEWQIKSAWIKDLKGKTIIDFKRNNLHVVNYSRSIKKTILFKNLKKKINSIKNYPSAIPYVTSYYKNTWGFCMNYNTLKTMKEKYYRINIDSCHFKGSMDIGEILIKGKSKKEILLSTYICHPSMANNELSGPALLIFLSKWIQSKKRYFSYRIVFLPETIGSIAYIHKNKQQLKKNVLGGYVITCVGDDRTYSYMPSKNLNSFINDITERILNINKLKYKKYSWLDRGSDERQYNWPNCDLNIGSLMRSKYHTYKEYHTSEDNLIKVVSSRGLSGTLKIYKKIILEIEKSIIPIALTTGEPMLSNLSLYPKTGNFFSKNKKKKISKQILTIMSYSDGKTSAKKIANLSNMSYANVIKICRLLKRKNLIDYV